MESQVESGVVSRRVMIQAAGAAAVAAALTPGAVRADENETGRAPRGRRVLRIAHLTDIHVEPERKAGEGLTACLHHVQSLKDRPDVIFVGGDMVMDSIGADEGRTRTQWDLFTKVFRTECSLPVEYCIGNHDCWGLNKKESKTSGSERLYGKKWVMEAVGLDRRYRSFEKAGWHFIVLDSTFPVGDGYTARLDDEQLAWLQGDLKSAEPARPVLLLSHIPILSASAYLDGDNEKTGDWVVPGAWMHIDARKIKDLFLQHRNVKLCLSGHIHLVDLVEYLGVTYLCDGAVCGGWWKGPYQECEPGYGVVDLYADGGFEHQYVTYGWEPATE
jgi:Icc protein